MCVHRAESTDWHQPGPGSYGGFQFGIGTWLAVLKRHSLPFPSNPADATPFQQTLAAWYEWIDSGRSWVSAWLQYDHAYYCLNA